MVTSFSALSLMCYMWPSLLSAAWPCSKMVSIRASDVLAAWLLYSSDARNLLRDYSNLESLKKNH